jgi:CrcB protein
LTTIVLIGVGGAIGANARYLVSTWAAGRYGVSFPYGTFLINATGSVLIGFVLTLLAAFLGSSPEARLMLVTGFLGAYTTFSTFTYETIALVREAEFRPALLNALGSVVLGVAGCAIGILAAELLAGRLS